MINRNTIESTLGKTFADDLDAPLFAVGAMKFSRREMVNDLHCGSFIAARKLEKALKKYDITTPARLFKTDPGSLLRIKGVGPSTVYVAMCVLDAHGYSVEKWWGWNEQNDLKFDAFKRNVTKRAKRGPELGEIINNTKERVQ